MYVAVTIKLPENSRVVSWRSKLRMPGWPALRETASDGVIVVGIVLDRKAGSGMAKHGRVDNGIDFLRDDG
jgi:hypothetical protein